MRFLFSFLLTLILLLNISCIHLAKNPGTLNWYKPITLKPLPLISLAGKKILIDPGHGNASSGAVGLNGIKEKDLNLKVAFYLRTLLENQGALVYMTRETDTAKWWSVGLSDRDDLGRRCFLRDSIKPDLFISIHHNGSDDGSPEENISKVFYAFGDAGASLDAARYINMEFTELLGLGGSLLLCGNYFVLRDNADVPSVLGEPCYLSNPVMENILRDSASLKLEALAYFRGIVKWFTAGVPKIEGFSVDTVNGTVTVNVTGEKPLDPALTSIYLNGARLNGKVGKGSYTAPFPLPLRNGTNIFKCRAGNVYGNFSPCADLSFDVNRPAGTLIATLENQSSSGLVGLRVSVLDCYGLPVRDGTKVELNDESSSLTEDGVAVFHVQPADTARTVDVKRGNVIIHQGIPATVKSLHQFQGFISSIDTSFKVTDCIISVADTSFAPDMKGWFSISSTNTQNGISASITCRGFSDTMKPLDRNRLNIIKLVPREKGILIGKKIIIDPEFGGVEFGGLSTNGIRACDITRKIALEISGLLEHYGCDTRLARDEDRTISIPERILESERFCSDVYIIIRADSVNQSPYISYLRGSRPGKSIAKKLAVQWKRVSGYRATVLEEHSIIMQQTRCPAVTLSVTPLNSSDQLNYKKLQFTAQTVVNGLIDFFEDDDK